MAEDKHNQTNSGENNPEGELPPDLNAATFNGDEPPIDLNAATFNGEAPVSEGGEPPADLNNATVAGEGSVEEHERRMPSEPDLKAATFNGDAPQQEGSPDTPPIDLNAATFNGGAPVGGDDNPPVDLNNATVGGDEPASGHERRVVPEPDLNAATFNGDASQQESSSDNPPIDLNAATFDGGHPASSGAAEPPIDLNAATFNGDPAAGGNTPPEMDLNAATISGEAPPADGNSSSSAIMDLNAATYTDANESSAHQSSADLNAATITGAGAPKSSGVQLDLNAATMAGTASGADLIGATITEDVQELWAATISSNPDDLTEGMTIKGDDETSSSAFDVTPNKSTHITVNTRIFHDPTQAPSVEVKSRYIQDGKTPAVPGVAADYEVLKVLGEGGMGIVYQARQTSIDRSIAVKMIKKEGADDPNVRDKFLAEAAVTGDLDHPNIVPIHDLGDNGKGALFYAMKHVKGDPWCDVIKDKTLNENLGILDDVCNAMAFAHDHGIVHRDLKPENVMLGGYGEVLVMDWGLAAAFNDDGKAERLRQRTSVCGTPAYMSPEMALGEGDKIGPASDIYLLGAMLYESICGFPPHTGQTIMKCLENAALNVFRETDKKGELLDIALKAMSYEPGDRYDTVLGFQNAIKEYRSHSESISLTDRGKLDLAEAEKSKQYEDFSKAIFGFQEAINLWDGNSEAKVRLSEARLAYAKCSLEKGDLDLAESQLVEDTPPFRELRYEVKLARADRDKRARQLTVAKYAGIAAACVFILGVSAALYMINQESKKAQEQARIAKEQEAIAQDEKDKAKAQEAIAKLEKDKAKQEKEAADAAKKVAEAEKERAQEALKQAKKAELARRLEETRAAKLRDSSRWALSSEKAIEAQKTSASKHGLEVRKTIMLPGDNVKLELALIPEGMFSMGSPPDEASRASNEALHDVMISKPFYMGIYEVTQEQWRAIMPGKQPSAFKGKQVTPRHPVENVSYDDIKNKFLPAIQKYAPQGFVFTLPTEAEWEYACRAGSATAFNFGADKKQLGLYAWFGGSGGNSDKKTHYTGGRKPNAWGLFDMHGNVVEWCEDTYEDDYYLTQADKIAAENEKRRQDENYLPLANDPVNREDGTLKVVRGGGWMMLQEQCRSAYRSSARPERALPFLGFRLVLRKNGKIEAVKTQKKVVEKPAGKVEKEAVKEKEKTPKQ